jgi:hypothetical protein
MSTVETQTRTVFFKDIQNFLVQEYAKARTQPGLGQRWVNALDKAWLFFQNTPAITYSPNGDLLYPSESTAGTVYKANGTCQCPAFQDGQPCKHRAASRLLANALKAHDKAFNEHIQHLAERYGEN